MVRGQLGRLKINYSFSISYPISFTLRVCNPVANGKLLSGVPWPHSSFLEESGSFLRPAIGYQ